MGAPTHPKHEQNRMTKARLFARVIEDEGHGADWAEILDDEGRRRIERRTAELIGRDDDMRSSPATWVLTVNVLREREAARDSLKIAGGAEAFGVVAPPRHRPLPYVRSD